ncbi:hypothetical protein SERLADRAFT_387421 [Serpula lacrymans var. lacrymans S7.9]|uniref:Uncharacterized protein n=1 Tax=Serpula lacrymans var. lacrymans (strain S7.9) TaxID=578457 RepID=F8NSY2_SERL9|nr:uncharacterized protein SERLADRAFT_387421 [Serpula lacrymans var. lacrymans S7.9]EGO25455.1 hypothetical protein SERLADRAFT_387421 [Serpula lacrymans var. lacrymans S7.9]
MPMRLQKRISAAQKARAVAAVKETDAEKQSPKTSSLHYSDLQNLGSTRQPWQMYIDVDKNECKNEKLRTTKDSRPA